MARRRYAVAKSARQIKRAPRKAPFTKTELWLFLPSTERSCGVAYVAVYVFDGVERLHLGQVHFLAVAAIVSRLLDVLAAVGAGRSLRRFGRGQQFLQAF